MTTIWDSIIEKRFQDKIQEDSAKAYTKIFAVMIPFFASFAVIDLFIQPAKILPYVFGIRILALLVLTFGYFEARKNPRLSWLPFLLVSTLTVCITSFSFLSQEGYKASYFFGISLVVLCMSYLFPWGLKKMARWTFGVVFFYLAVVIGKTKFKIDEPMTLINVVAFTSACCFIASWGAWISDRLRRECFARLLEAESEQAINARITAALEARNEFISIASHELKTPITTLQLHSWLLKKQLQQSNDAQSDQIIIKTYLEKNEKQMSRLTRLIEDMLDISRITTGTIKIEPERMDLGNLVQEIIERFTEQFQAAGIDVHLQAQGNLWGDWDRLRLDQVVTNLFLNAIKYAPNAPLEVLVQDDGTQVILRVKDHGPGVKKEYQEKIFERFERGNANMNIAGLGLGLYIGKQVIDGHGGSIQVESPEEGACFRVNLPRESTLLRVNHH